MSLSIPLTAHPYKLTKAKLCGLCCIGFFSKNLAYFLGVININFFIITAELWYKTAIITLSLPHLTWFYVINIAITYYLVIMNHMLLASIKLIAATNLDRKICPVMQSRCVFYSQLLQCFAFVGMPGIQCFFVCHKSFLFTLLMS